MKTIAVLSFLLLGTVAFAQQTQPTPFEQALSTKLNSEINGGLQCSANLVMANIDLAKARERIKELEEKFAKEK